MGLASCGSMSALLWNSLWLIAVDPYRSGSISLRPASEDRADTERQQNAYEPHLGRRSAGRGLSRLHHPAVSGGETSIGERTWGLSTPRVQNSDYTGQGQYEGTW